MSDQRSETWRPGHQQGPANRETGNSFDQKFDQQREEASCQGDAEGRTDSGLQYESQVQDDDRTRSPLGRDHSKASFNRDDRPNPGYFCNRCKKCIKKVGYTAEYTHEQHIADCWPGGVEGVDYVECRLCKFVALKITQHVRTKHGLTKEEYEKLYGSVRCAVTANNYSAVNAKNGDWIRRKKESGEDLTEYTKKMGVAVSHSIMSNPEERRRRARLMGSLNKTPKARERSSTVAKLTSSRPEILERRTTALRNWRNENWEDFYEKCVKRFSFSEIRMSNPEVCLRSILENIQGYNFVWSQVIKSDTFENKSKRKQVDFGDKTLRVYVEFDGIHHFKCFKIREDFERTQRNDVALDDHIEKHGWTLIRISYDQYDPKSKFLFKESCLKMLYEILQNPTPGVHRIGLAYNQGEVK